MAQKLTKQQSQVLLLILMFAGGGGYYYWNFMIKPVREVIAQRREKLDDLVGKIEKAQRASRRLPALQEELEKLRLEASEIEKQLPTGEDIPNIIRVITREALQEDLTFKSLNPEPPVRQPYFQVLQFSISFSGGLHNLARFLSSMGQQERIFQAQNLSLTATRGEVLSGATTPLTISLKLQTYAYTG